MNQQDKIVIKTQLQAIASQLTAVGNLAASGASAPIITPMGPAAAPGLLQMGAAMQQQTAMLGNLIGQVIKIVDAA